MALEIKESRNGLGIFANQTYKANEIIFEVLGKVVHYKKVLKIGGKFADNTFRFDTDNYLSPQGYIGEFLNHSCDPNCKVIKKNKKLYIVAIKKVKPGQQVVIDYTTILAADDIWKMNCNCGSVNCRRKIKKITSLTKNILDKYIKEKIAPDYILNISNLSYD